MTSAPLLITDSSAANRIFSNLPTVTSEGLGWQGVNMESRQYLPNSGMPDVCFPGHLITFMSDAPGPTQVVRRFNGKPWKGEAFIGEPVIVPAGHSYGVEWRTLGDPLQWDRLGSCITLAIDTQDFATTVNLAQEPSQLELTPLFAKSDPLLYQLALGLKGLLESGAHGHRLYAETLTHTLMMHLLHHYTTRKLAVKAYSDGLSPTKLKLVLDYIQSNLDQDLGLKDLASLLQLSPHYFSHLFKRSVGLAPHQYVVKQRIKRARELLQSTDMAIAEVAYEVGFSSQAHLTRRFKEIVGTTPGKYRRS